jgi:hypothetical protein
MEEGGARRNTKIESEELAFKIALLSQIFFRQKHFS